MIIESVKKIKDKRESFLVQFDNGTDITVSAAQIADFGIHTGRDLSEDEYEELLESLSLSSSKARALRMLGSRSLSERELLRRLKSKGTSHEAAEKTVEWLEEIGMVNDTDYAASIVSYYSARAYGKARIRNELYKRGIDRELWDEAMRGIEENEDAADAAHEFVAKKLRGSIDKDDLLRAAEALCRRGFSFDEARSAINKYLENAEAEERRKLSEENYGDG